MLPSIKSRCFRLPTNPLWSHRLCLAAFISYLFLCSHFMLAVSLPYTHLVHLCVGHFVHTLPSASCVPSPRYIDSSVHCLPSDSVKTPSQRSLVATTTLHNALLYLLLPLFLSLSCTCHHETQHFKTSDLICVLLKSKGHESPGMKLLSVSFLGPNRAWCVIVAW